MLFGLVCRLWYGEVLGSAIKQLELVSLQVEVLDEAFNHANSIPKSRGIELSELRLDVQDLVVALEVLDAFHLKADLFR